jgi:hypothetical protein
MKKCVGRGGGGGIAGNWGSVLADSLGRFQLTIDVMGNTVTEFGSAKKLSNPQGSRCSWAIQWQSDSVAGINWWGQ